MLKGATVQMVGGKLVCTLVAESDADLTFGLVKLPDLKISRSDKADNTHVDLTLTVRVANLITLTNQPDLI
jgi:hypothetical protein